VPSTLLACSDDYGRILLPFLLGMKSWINRRVDRFQIDDGFSVTATSSVDFSLIKADQMLDYKTMLTEGKLPELIVPFAFLSKAPLKGFDLTSEGKSIPLLGQAESTEIALSVVRHSVLLLSEDWDLVRESVRIIIDSDVAEAKHELVKWEYASGLTDESNCMRRLWKRLSFQLLLSELAGKFIAIAILPSTISFHRHIIKFGFRSVFRWSSLLFPSRFAWSPGNFLIEVPSASYAGSYHIEVEAPSGADICGLKLGRQVPLSSRRTWLPGLFVSTASPLFAAGSSKGDVRELIQNRATQTKKLWASFFLSTWRNRRRRGVAHLHPPARDIERRVQYLIKFGVLPQRRGFVRSAFVCAFLVWSVLELATHFPPPVGTDAVKLSSPLLLLFPGLLSAYIAKPNDHALVGRLCLGIRATLIIATIAVFGFAAALFGLVPTTPFVWQSLNFLHGSADEVVRRVSLTASRVACIILFITYLTTSRREAY
jgi:hypothetical protein